MKCSGFIATSVDGFIATLDGGVEWLDQAGKQSPEFAQEALDSFAAYLSSVDAMIMGRKCMEKIASMKLTPEQWPYGDINIVVLSRTLSEVPQSMRGKMQLYSGEIPSLLQDLKAKGFQHVYVDGGTTITSFLELGLLDELTITRAPVLLGEGIPLFGKLSRKIDLTEPTTATFRNDFVQLRYRVSSSD